MRQYINLTENLFKRPLRWSEKELTSLEGLFDKFDIDTIEFIDLSRNEIRNLKGLPKICPSVNLMKNRLESLEGSPRIIKGYFDIANNPTLKSLEGGPEEIRGYFDCSETGITSLKGCPKFVNGTFDCSDTNITSLEGMPEKIRNGSNFYCKNPNLTPEGMVPCLFSDLKNVTFKDIGTDLAMVLEKFHKLSQEEKAEHFLETVDLIDKYFSKSVRY